MRTLLVVAVAVSLGSAALAQKPASYAIDNPKAQQEEAVARAMKTFDTLQATLSARLVEEMKAGGPARAIAVCRDEAPALTAKVAKESGMELGRTSDRLRNPANAPRPWVEPWIQANAGRKAADVKAVVVHLDDRVAVLRPIAMAGPCTTCHGTDARRAPAIKDLLATHYPQDQAVGFEEGDVRGYFWAEVPAAK